jgi:hypothetical protein
MLATTLAFSASAKATLPQNTNQANYDQTSKIILTTDQYSTLILDYLDETLAKAGIYLNIADLLGDFPLKLSGELDLRSIDAALDSLKNFQGTLNTVYNLVPVLSHGGLNLTYVQNGHRRSSTATNGDTVVLQEIFQIFSDPNRSTDPYSNPKVFGSLVKALLGTSADLNAALGTIGALLPALIPGGLDVPKMLKEMLWSSANPDAEEVPAVLPTLDALVQGLLQNLLGETTIKIGEDTELDLGAIISEINIETDSVYSLVDKILKPVYEEALVPLINGTLKDLLADAAESADFGAFVDLDFTAPTWAEIEALGVGTTSTIFDQLNNVIKLFFDRIITLPAANWALGTNALLVPNIIAVGKILIKEFGEDIFPGVKFKTDAEIDGLSDMAFVAYLTKTIVNALMYFVYVPDSINGQEIDTLTEVLNVVLIEQAGDTIPERYDVLTTAYYNSPGELDKLATTLEILSDYLVKLLYFTADTNVSIDRSSLTTADKKAVTTAAGAGSNTLRYADSFEQVVAKLFNWVVGNYGGVLNPSLFATPVTTPANAWKSLTNILFSLIDSSWLGGTGNYGKGSGQRGVKELLVDDIIGQLLGSKDTLNPGQIQISKALEIFSKNPTGGLNKTVAEVLIKLVLDVLDLVLGNASGNVSTTAMRDPVNGYKKLEDILTKTDYLATLVTNLISGLGVAGDRLLPTALPLLSDILKLTTDAAYRAPEFDLEHVIPYSATHLITVENASGGLPGMNYNPGQGKQEEPTYIYRLRSATLNYVDNVTDPVKTNGALTLVKNSNGAAFTTINPLDLGAGEKAVLRLNLPAAVTNSLVTIALQYAVMTSQGVTIANLTTHLYTFVADKDLYYRREKLSETEEILVLNDDAHKKPVVDEGTAFINEGIGSPLVADDGFSNAITYPEFFFANQNTTLGDLVNTLNLTVTRSADLGEMNEHGDITKQPTNTEDSFVTFDPFYNYFGDYQGEFKLDAANVIGSKYGSLLDYVTIKDPAAEGSKIVTTNATNTSVTFKPFEVIDPDEVVEVEIEDLKTGLFTTEELARKDIPIMALPGFADGGYVNLRIFLASDGTRPDTTGRVDEQLAEDDAESFLVLFTFAVENDYGLPSLVNGAIARDEQASRYTNADFFNTYMNNLSKAAYLAFKVKNTSLLMNGLGNFYRTFSSDMEELQGYASTNSATANLEALLQKVYGLKDNATVDPVTGEKTYLNYWDPAYTYFDSSDFIPTGFKKALSAISMAESLIARAKDPEGANPPSSMEIDYCTDLLKNVCDSRIELFDGYTISDQQYNDWQLLPTVAYEHAMEYQLAWLESNQVLGSSGVTFAQVKAAFDGNGGYDATGDYTTTVLDGAGGFIILDGASVRALLRAYDNTVAIVASFAAGPYADYIDSYPQYSKYAQLGRNGTPPFAEFQSDTQPYEIELASVVAATQPTDIPLRRIPQSQLTRARDELVYAYKRVVAASEKEEPPVTPDGLNWAALDTIYNKLTNDVASEGKTLQALFTEYADAFVPAYKVTYDTLFATATNLLTTVKGDEDAEAAYTQTEINTLAANLTKASKLLVAVVPNVGAYVYSKTGLPAGIKADLTAYNGWAATAQAQGKSVKEYFLPGEAVLRDSLAGGEAYDGYIYGLDITKPTLLGVSGKPVPYKVINGTADAPVANAAGKYLTGAKLIVKDSDGAVLFTLKTVYFGDPNGNGTVLEDSELNDLGMVIAGVKWTDSINDVPVAGAYAPATLAMDVVASGTLDAADFTNFRLTGTRYVDQVANPLTDYARVIKGKPTAPIA